MNFSKPDYNQVSTTMNETLLESIIENIAEVEGVESINLDSQIYHHISTDAITRLENHESKSWRLQFEIPNHVVEVTGNGEILIDGVQMETVD
ncbi:HalOD1 output domain-containing protein [Halorubrum distributum]|uniref:Halobacterial output domain-containing protein n=1 Tax=Halorubrum distributum JCM 13916 TaxID=1230455 RepID=M0PUT9_9EURY|nr:HalOD1 output domain-containing protein [Halorubrum arcis]EMA72605.1 hypothetical protein C462_00993 [Halorubrum arcis JCM 13916]